MGLNEIYDNKFNGMYLTASSGVDMGGSVIILNDNYFNTDMTGYNNFRDNGYKGYETEESAEICFDISVILMGSGNNTLDDNRNNTQDND